MRELYYRFSPYINDYKWRLFLAVFGMIITGAATSASAWLVDPVLNKIFIEKDENLLYILPYVIIIIYAIKSGGAYMQVYYTVYIGQDMVRRLRDDMVAKIIDFDMKFFNEFRTGELISRTVNDMERIRNVVSNFIPDFITQIIMIIGLLGVIIYQSPKLAFFAIFVLPAAIYPLSYLAKKMKKLSKNSQEKTSDISSSLSQIFTNIEIIKANNAQRKEVDEFKEENHNFFKLNVKAAKTNALVSPIMETLGSIGLAFVIIIGGKEVIEGRMDMGSFFSFVTALFMLYKPIKTLSSLYNKMQDALAASERTFDLMDRVPSIVGGNAKFPNSINSITLQNIHLNYDEKAVLKGINLSVKKGENLALVGNSGGGKSSIVNLLMRFYDASDGSILIDQNDISEFNLYDLRENIGLVSQRIYIFNDTIAKNVCYGGVYDEKRVINALKMANAYEFVSRLDDGIHHKLSEFGANLSGGQRQRIAIARMLYKNPQIIILDEATSALDNVSEKEITKVIENFRKDKIIIIIAHRLSTIQNATKIALINDGKVVAVGDDEKLTNECEMYAKLKGTLLSEN